MKKTRAFLKWAGGKYSLVEEIAERLPAGRVLLEPFVGAGSVFLNTDYDAYVLNDINPDLIGLYNHLKRQPDNFIREARKAGFAGNLYNVSFVGTQALLDELGKDARGVAVSQVMPFPYSPATSLSGEYLAAVRAKQGRAPNYSGIEGYVAAKVFTEALSRAGRGLSREGFINAIEGIRGLDLGGFPVDFGPNKHTGSRFVELTLLTEDGRVRR